jgi:hypothetical protein
MLLAALEQEVEQYVQSLRHLRDNQGQALVVRNGKAHHERTIQLGAESIRLRAPRVNNRLPDHRFSSWILPPYIRCSPPFGRSISRVVSTWPIDQGLLRSVSSLTGAWNGSFLGHVVPYRCFAAAVSGQVVTVLWKVGLEATGQDNRHRFEHQCIQGRLYVECILIDLNTAHRAANGKSRLTGRPADSV